MGYKVDILTRCENEEEASVVISAALAMVMNDNNTQRLDYKLVVKNLKRMSAVSPIWNKAGRHERFQRKLNT